MNILSRNLEKLIAQKGLSNRHVSLAAGKNQQLVADIIKGRTKSPSIETLAALAKALKVPINQLTGEKVSEKPDLEILGVCLLWVLQNIERLSNLPPERIVDELMRQYGRMLSDRMGDKMEAVRITRYLFENILDQRELPALPKAKPAPAKKPARKAKPAVKKPPRKSLQK